MKDMTEKVKQKLALGTLLIALRDFDVGIMVGPYLEKCTIYKGQIAIVCGYTDKGDSGYILHLPSYQQSITAGFLDEHWSLFTGEKHERR